MDVVPAQMRSELLGMCVFNADQSLIIMEIMWMSARVVSTSILLEMSRSARISMLRDILKIMHLSGFYSMSEAIMNID